MLALEEGTAVQAVVGSIVWVFRRLKKPRSREMSARVYALHSVRPQLSFLFLCRWNAEMCPHVYRFIKGDGELLFIVL